LSAYLLALKDINLTALFHPRAARAAHNGLSRKQVGQRFYGGRGVRRRRRNKTLSLLARSGARSVPDWSPLLAQRRLWSMRQPGALTSRLETIKAATRSAATGRVAFFVWDTLCVCLHAVLLLVVLLSPYECFLVLWVTWGCGGGRQGCSTERSRPSRPGEWKR